MLRKTLLCCVLMILLTNLFVPLKADSGFITPGFNIYEPWQYAIIAWNNGWEILYLTSYINTLGAKGKIIQIIPFPSVPEVYIGNAESYYALEKVLDNYGIDISPISVILSKAVGPHNITVFYVNDTTDFVQFISTYASSNNLEFIHISTAMVNNIDYYISRGYRYFCVDIINLTRYDVSIVPIIFKFRSSTIYYPMRISSSNKGSFEMHLFFLTSFPINAKSLKNHVGICWTKVVSRDIVNYIDPRLLSIFMPWQVSFYLTYAYGKGEYSADRELKDIEIEPPFSWYIYQVVSLLNVFLVVGFMIYDTKKARILYSKKSYRFVLYIDLVLSILLLTNLTNLLGPDNFYIRTWLYEYPLLISVELCADIVYTSIDWINMMILLTFTVLSVSLLNRLLGKDYISLSKISISNESLQKYLLIFFGFSIIVICSFQQLMRYIIENPYGESISLIVTLFVASFLIIVLVIINLISLRIFLEIKSDLESVNTGD